MFTLSRLTSSYSKGSRMHRPRKSMIAFTLILLLIGLGIAGLIFRYHYSVLLFMAMVVSNLGQNSTTVYIIIYFSLLLFSFLLFRRLLHLNARTTQVSLATGGDISAPVDFMSRGSVSLKDKEMQEMLDGYKMLVSRSEGVILTENEKIIFVNKYFCKLTGYSPSQVIGHLLAEFIAPFDLHAYWTLFR